MQTYRLTVSISDICGIRGIEPSLVDFQSTVRTSYTIIPFFSTTLRIRTLTIRFWRPIGTTYAVKYFCRKSSTRNQSITDALLSREAKHLVCSLSILRKQEESNLQYVSVLLVFKTSSSSIQTTSFFCNRKQIRTVTERGLNPMPLPIGLLGHCCIRGNRTQIAKRRQFYRLLISPHLPLMQ